MREPGPSRWEIQEWESGRPIRIVPEGLLDSYYQQAVFNPLETFEPMGGI